MVKLYFDELTKLKSIFEIILKENFDVNFEKLFQDVFGCHFLDDINLLIFKKMRLLLL